MSQDWNSIDKMTDNCALVKTQILSDIMSSCYIAKPATLLPLAAIRMVNLTLDYGISVHSAFGFALLAVYLCAIKQDMKCGNDIGNVALFLVEKFPSKEAIVNVNTAIFILVKCWSVHIRLLIKPMLHTFKFALAVGDHEKTEFCMNNYCLYMLVSGQSIENVANEIGTFAELQFLNKTIPDTLEKILKIFSLSESRNPSILIHNMTEEFIGSSDVSLTRLSRVFLLILMVATYFHEYEISFRLIQVKASSAFLAGTYLSVMMEFYVGLVLLSIVKRNPKKVECMDSALGCISKLKTWSIHVPDNISNKSMLLEAEMAAVKGNKILAIQLYNKAISLCKKNNFIHEEALTCEKAGIYCDEVKDKGMAAQFLFQAYYSYYEWGATAKMLQLRNLYPMYQVVFDSIHASSAPTAGVPLDICLRPSSISIVSEFNSNSIAPYSNSRKNARSSFD